jgi:peptide/nickel transport system substrate-binding protein
MDAKRLISWIVFVASISLPADSRNILRIGIGSFPGSVNPVYATDEVSQGIVNKVYQSLFSFDRNGRIRNELVKNATLDANQLEATIELREGARFSNGKYLNSDDVLATVLLLKNPAFQYPYQGDLSFIDRVAKMDARRFSIHLKERFAPWRNYLTFKILCSAEIRAMDPARFKTYRPSGSGPFRIQKMEEPSRIWLDRNPYSSGRRGPCSIEYWVLLDSRQAPLKLITGELDAVEMDPQDARIFLGNQKWQNQFRLVPYLKFGFTYLAFNLKNPHMDRNLQKIIYNQVIRGTFLNTFLKDSGIRVYSPFLYLNTGLKPIRFATLPLKNKQRLRILTNSESRLRKHLVLFLMEELKTAGIELEPLFLEYHTFLKYLKEGRFDMALSGYVLDIDWNLRDILGSSSFFNYAHYANPAMDQLLTTGLQEMDEKKREDIYRQAHVLWQKELPFIPLFNLYYYIGVSRRIKIPTGGCPVVGSTGDFFYDIEEWGE